MDEEIKAYIKKLSRTFPREKSIQQSIRALKYSPGFLPMRILMVAHNYFFGDRLLALLYKFIKNGLPPEICDLVSREQVVLAEIYDPIPSAYVKLFPNNNAVIVYNHSLFQFIYRVCRAFVAHFVELDKREHLITDKLNGVRIISEIFWWYENTGMTLGPDYKLSRSHVIVASRLAQCAEAFFLSHEFGHIASYIDNQYSHDDIEEELWADKFALLVIERGLKNGGWGTNSPEIVWLGTEIGLLIFAALETLGVDFGTNHPPFDDRMELVRTVAEDVLENTTYFDKFLQLSEQCREIFANILRITNSPDKTEEEYYSDQEDKILSIFKDILERCSNYPKADPLALKADHETFNIEMTNLFNVGFPYVILEETKKIGRNVIIALDDCIHDPYNSQKAKRFALEFNKLRVLALFFSETHEPARTLFLKSLQRPADLKGDQLSGSENFDVGQVRKILSKFR
ncbi:MAG: hypothetical protein ACYC6G_09190 [Desulfobaccales bacterium]